MLFPQGKTLFRARLEGEAPFSLDLLQGAHRLRVLTYSASETLVRELALGVEEIEVILGHPRPATGLSDLLALQHLALEELQGELQTPGQEEVYERLKAGRLRVYLSRVPSHAKLFLVERQGKRYALLGSANLSPQALERSPGQGGQLELLLLLEDEGSFLALEQVYGAVLRESDRVRPEVLTRKVEPHELPLLEKAAKGPLILEVPKEVPVVYRIDLQLKRAQPYRPLEAELRPKGGLYRLGPEHAKVVRLSPPKGNSPLHHGAFQVEEGGLRVGESLQPFLSLQDPGVAEDAQAMAGFLEGYLQGEFLHEEEAQAQVENYWRLWCWFWTAPLMSRLLRRAHLGGLPPHAYPLYALVYGKANSGKTTFLRLLSRSLAGAEVRLFTGTEIGQQSLLAVHASGVLLPAVFDDVSPEDVRSKVEKVMKSLYENPPEEEIAPVALSLNQGESYAPPDEVKKRALLVWAPATLDLNDPRSKRAHERAQRLLLALGNRLYRAFLPRLLPALEGEGDWLRASSTALARLLEETLGQRPPWAREVSEAALGEETRQRVRTRVEALLKDHAGSLEVRDGKVILRLGPEAYRIGRELPGWLVEEVRGQALFFSPKGLQRLGLWPPQGGKGGWLSRLLRRPR